MSECPPPPQPLLASFRFGSASSSSTSGDGTYGNESADDEYEEASSVGHQQKLRLLILLQLVKNMAATKRRVVS